MAKVGVVEAQRAQAMRRPHGVAMRMVDRPGRRPQSALVVEHVTQEKRRLRVRVEADAAGCMPGTVDHGKAGDGFAILEDPPVAPGTTHDKAREALRQSIGQTPDGHPLPWPAGLQVRGIGSVHREACARRLAEGEGRAGVVDVMMGEDDPVDRAQALRRDEPKHRLEAARVPGVDDGQPFSTVVEVGLGAADARDPPDHMRIIGYRDGVSAAGLRAGSARVAAPRPEPPAAR